MRAAADYLAGNIHGAELVRFAQSAHIPSVEHPVDFETLLLDWLRRNRL